MLHTLILGIEGGGTKTECAALDNTGQLLGYGRGGASNLNFVSVQEQQEAIRTAISEAIKGLKGKVEAIGLAVAGCPPDVNWLRKWLQVSVIFRYEEPRAAMAITGMLQAHGIAVIAGTGSLIGYFRQGQFLGSVGGWGSLLGDEGSAYEIALQGIRAALRAYDRRGEPTSLVEAVGRYFEVSDLRELIPLFYRQPMPRHRIAGFAQQVSSVAEEQKDPIAIRILQAAGEILARDTIAGAKRYFEPSEEVPVALCGGVFRSRRYLVPAFEQVIAEAFPNARFRLPRHRPATAVAHLTLRDWKRRQ